MPQLRGVDALGKRLSQRAVAVEIDDAPIREMPDAMARYKSILPIRAPLLAWLDGRAGGQGPNIGR